jgi:two-component system phosphate regulon sensor histidine kinase PhoR
LFWRDLRREAQLAALRTHFVASVSHELRTPLTAIRMFTEALHGHEDISAETRKEYLATMLRENERLSRLVENILEFSRMERNQRQYQLRPVKLQDIIHSVLAVVEPLIEHGGFRLDKDIAPDVPQVLADRDALGQALFNLLSNAMKYSGQSRSLGIELRQEGRRAVIRVSDSGAGIAPSEQRLIFDSFYRSRSPENDAIPGAGLGLTLVRHVMEGHQGEVTVSSRLGEGSTFSLMLPMYGEEGKR